MPRDLAELLEATALAPSAPVDVTRIQVRGRRRRRLRQAAVGTGTAALIALAAAVGIDALMTESERPEILDQPHRTEDPPDVGVDDAGVDDAPSDDAEGRPPGDGTDEVVSIPPDETGRALLLAGEMGVHRIDGSSQQQLSELPAIAARPDLQGGVIVQDRGVRDGLGEGAIRWLPTDGEPQELASEDERPTLHVVVERDGAPTVLFTRRRGQGDQETETLYSYRLGDGTEQEFGVVARMDSHLSGIGMLDGDLLLLICHLECRLWQMPWGADPQGETTDDLYPDRSVPLHGLDAAAGTAASLHLPSPAAVDPEDGGSAAPTLWLDLGQDDPRELSLPAPDDAEQWTATVALAVDASAALITYHRYDEPDARPLLVEGLQSEPRIRWLTTTDRVWFADPDGDDAG